MAECCTDYIIEHWCNCYNNSLQEEITTLFSPSAYGNRRYIVFYSVTNTLENAQLYDLCLYKMFLFWWDKYESDKKIMFRYTA